jgi:hypothetical protein
MSCCNVSRTSRPEEETIAMSKIRYAALRGRTFHGVRRGRLPRPNQDFSGDDGGVPEMDGRGGAIWGRLQEQARQKSNWDAFGIEKLGENGRLLR